jgi:hypothetical protein
MPEQLQLDIKADQDFIYVFDATGEFKKKQNECGWGSPNLRVTDITKAEITVFIPCVTEPVVIDVYPSLPNDSCIGFEIAPADLGLQNIPSGVWKFEYRAFLRPGTETEEVFVVTCYQFFTAAIRCCIDSRKPDFDIVNIDSEANKKTIELEAVLEIAEWAACKGDLDSAQEMAKYLTLQCECC